MGTAAVFRLFHHFSSNFRNASTVTGAIPHVALVLLYNDGFILAGILLSFFHGQKFINFRQAASSGGLTVP